MLQNIIPRSPNGIFDSGKDGIEVVGFFQSASGIGESARLCAQQLRDAGHKVRCTSVEKIFRRGKEIDWQFEDTATEDEIGCRIIHLNPPMMPPYVITTGLCKFRDIYNIGYWAWELEDIPPEWIRATRYVNAVFCPSEFTSRTIRKYTDKPVITVPHPVSTGKADMTIRQKLGLQNDTYLVSCIFSFGSALDRKNPSAVVRAFTSAFSPDDNACLVVKSNAGHEAANAADKKRFLEEIQSHKNIRLIDDVWSREEILGLLKTSDAYISLHRSEGFGLTIAEAMLLGTPTIVTNWSGNVDFCTNDNSYPVGYSMIDVQTDDPEYIALKNVKWAEADSAQTAEILKKIYKDREEAQIKAQRCLEKTNAYFSEPKYVQSLSLLKRGTA